MTHPDQIGVFAFRKLLSNALWHILYCRILEQQYLLNFCSLINKITRKYKLNLKLETFAERLWYKFPYSHVEVCINKLITIIRLIFQIYDLHLRMDIKLLSFISLNLTIGMISDLAFNLTRFLFSIRFSFKIRDTTNDWIYVQLLYYHKYATDRSFKLL